MEMTSGRSEDGAIVGDPRFPARWFWSWDNSERAPCHQSAGGGCTCNTVGVYPVCVAPRPDGKQMFTIAPAGPRTWLTVAERAREYR